jgi:hypothetical protein
MGVIVTARYMILRLSCCRRNLLALVIETVVWCWWIRTINSVLKKPWSVIHFSLGYVIIANGVRILNRVLVTIRDSTLAKDLRRCKLTGISWVLLSITTDWSLWLMYCTSFFNNLIIILFTRINLTYSCGIANSITIHNFRLLLILLWSIGIDPATVEVKPSVFTVNMASLLKSCGCLRTHINLTIIIRRISCKVSLIGNLLHMSGTWWLLSFSWLLSLRENIWSIVPNYPISTRDVSRRLLGTWYFVEVKFFS